MLEIFNTHRSGESPEQEWERVKSREDLNPNIKTHDQYRTAVAAGMQRALDTLRATPEVAPGPNLVSKVHKEIFRDVFLSAGEFRSAEASRVQLDNHGRNMSGHTSAPAKIRDDLDGAKTSCEKKLNDPDIRIQCEAIAQFAASLETIRPFPSGSKETSLVIMESQMEHKFGPHLARGLDAKRWQDGLVEVVHRGDIGPLTDLVVGMSCKADAIRVQQVEKAIAAVERANLAELQKTQQTRVDLPPPSQDQRPTLGR